MTSSSPTTRHLCAECGRRTKPVEPATVRALALEDRLDERGAAGGFRFCENETCPVVYRQAEGDLQLTVGDLTVEVFQKSDRPDRPVCYCFGYSVEDVRRDAAAGSTPGIIGDIEEKCRQGLDRCEVANPQGRCCLGNVRAIAKTARASDPTEEPEPDGCCAARKGDSAPAAAGAGPSDDLRAGRLAAGGAVIAAVLSSACCWLPLALIGLGVSVGGLAAFFEAYRSAFLGGTILLLGAGFYFVYIRKPACEPGDACAAPKRSRSRLNEILLWVATALVAAFALFPNYVGHLLGSSTSVPSAKASELAEAAEAGVQRSYAIVGMSCEACTAPLEDAIAQVPGVTAVEVSYRDEVARVTFAAAGEVNDTAVIEAIDDLGFEARVK